MKNKLTVIVSITVCILMVISVLSACSINKAGDEDTSTSIPDDSWSGAEDFYEPVDITDVELVAIVSEALGDKATGFNGDLSSLTDDQLEKVKEVAEEKGYIIEEENGDTEIKKNSNVQVSEVSEEKASEIYSKANVDTGTTVSDKQYVEISKAADEKGATAITNEKGNVTIIETTVVSTTAKQTESQTSSKTTTKNTTTTAPYVPSTSPVGTTKNKDSIKTTTGTTPIATYKKTTTAITASGGNTFGGNAHCLFSANAAASDGVISVGNTYITSSGKVGSTANGLIVKFDNSGNQLWYNILGGDEITKFDDVTVLTDGSIIAVGETLAKNLVKDSVYRCKGTVEGVISKYSSEGKLLWTKIFGGSGGDVIYAVAPTADGGFIIGGSSTSTDFDLKNVTREANNGFVAKMDADGNKSWITSLGGSLSCAVKGVATTSAGTVYATIQTPCKDGDFESLERPSSGTYTVVLKITNGNINWIKTFWDIGNVVLNYITAANDSGCVLAGSYSAGKTSNNGSFKGIYNGGSAGTFDGMIIKMTPSGEVSWKLPLIGFQSDFVTGITPVNGGYAFCGYTTSTNRNFAFNNRGDYDSFVGVVSEYGKLSSITSFGGAKSDRAQSVCSTGSSATSVYVSGATLSKDGSFASCSAKSDGEDSVGFALKFDLMQE